MNPRPESPSPSLFPCARARRGRVGPGLLALALLVGCRGADPGPSLDEARQAPSDNGAVATARALRGSISVPLTASGSVAPRRRTPLGPAVPGRITRIFVDVGDTVEEGDPIFQIDRAPYEIALQEATAGLSLARAQAAEAARVAQRMRELSRKRMASDQDYERTRTGSQVAKAQVEQAESRVARVGNDLDRTLVRAPYPGTVIDRRAHEGTMATVTPNTTVVVLQETSALEAILNIPASSPAVVRPGDRVRLHIEGVTAMIGSRVRTTTDHIDPASRTYDVRVPIDDPSGSVKAGAFVRAEIEPRAREAALLVDRSALLSRDGRTFVFRVVDGIARRVAVRVGVVDTDRAEILSGLEDGAEVVIGDAVSRMADGETLDPTRAQVAAPATEGPGRRPEGS